MKPDLWIALIPIVLVAVMMHWIPLWRRQNLWFGVTVPNGFRDTPQAHQVLHSYRVAVWAVALPAGLLTLTGVFLRAEWLIPAVILLQAGGSMAVFARGRNRTLPFSSPITVRSASLTLDTEALPGGTFTAIVPLAILLTTALYLRANWQQIPDRFAIHFNLSGAPDRWANRGWQAVFAPLLAGVMLNLFFLIFAQAILRYSPRARGADTTDWTARFRRVNLRLLVVTAWGTTLLLSWFALLPLLSGPIALSFGWVLPLLLVAGLVPFLWQMIRLSQEPGSGSDGTPDYAWKLGQFYYNPDDPALMVEKRFGVGYTLNFGNRASWWLLGLIAAPIIFVVFL